MNLTNWLQTMLRENFARRGLVLPGGGIKNRSVRREMGKKSEPSKRKFELFYFK